MMLQWLQNIQEVLPSEVDTSTQLSKNLKLKIPLYPLQWTQ